jgi:hypothetical protein
MQPQQPPYQAPYGSPLLNDIHTHFPAFLYTPDRFNTVRDVFRYISEQMTQRYDVYSSWRNYHRQTAQPQQQQQQSTWRPRTAHARVYVPATPPAQAQQQQNDIETFLGFLNQIDPTTGFSYRTLLGAAGNMTTLNPNLFWDPVAIVPSAAQISAGSTTYAAPTALDTPCAICQDTIAEGAQVRKLSHCNHFFHKTCVDDWFQRAAHCPVCRHDIRTRTAS